MSGAPEDHPGGISVKVVCGQLWMQLDGPGVVVVLDPPNALALAHMLASAVIELSTKVPAGEGVH